MYRAIVGTILTALVCCILHSGFAGAAPLDELEVTSDTPDLENDLLQPLDAPTPVQPLPSISEPAHNSSPVAAARAAFQQQDISKCLSLLTIAKARESALPPPRLILADMYFQANARAAGRAMLERVALENPGHPELWRLQGSVALSEGRWTEAIMHFEHGLSLPTPTAWTEAQQQTFVLSMKKGLVAANERRGDLQEATTLLGEMTDITPLDSKLRDRYASLLFQINRKDQAIEQFRIAYLRDNTLSPPELSMGIMYVNSGDNVQGDRWFARAVRAYPDNALVYFQIAVALMVQDRADASAKLSAKAAELGMDTGNLQMVRGYAKRQLRRYDEAEAFFRAALQKTPNDVAAMNQLALVLIEQNDDGKKQEALEIARKVLQARENSANAQVTLGWVMYRSGMVSEAEDAFRKALEKPGLGPEGLYLAGRAFSDQGRDSEASKVAQVLQTRITSPGIYVLRPAARAWLASQQEAGSVEAIP